jgi:ATP-dependent protease ClpP protease subunit
MSDLLLKKGKVLLFGDVDEVLAQEVYENLCHCQIEELHPTVYICSNGGDVECGAALVDKIIEMGADTCVIGKAYSISGIILAAGVNRYSYPNSCVMFHSCSYGGVVDSHENNQAYGAFCEITYTQLLKTVCANCEMSTRQTSSFVKKVKEGSWLTAKQAKKSKIITEILEGIDA